MTFWHGLRASEAVQITRDDVADGYLSVQRLKGSLRTVQPLVEHSDPLLNERPSLLELAAKTPRNQPLFPIGRRHFWRLFREYGEAAQLPRHKRHPHVLKHTIAMQSIDTAGIENTRQYLGHKSISSTGAYLRVSDQDASRAVQGAVGGRRGLEKLNLAEPAK